MLAALITDDGKLYTCGSNGQLGIEGSQSQRYPQPVSDDRIIKQVTCGDNHTAAVTEEERLLIFNDSLNHRESEFGRELALVSILEYNISQILKYITIPIFGDPSLPVLKYTVSQN